MAYARYVETIRALIRGDVEFLVVGMAAAIMQGAPSLTLDLDIVHKRSAENVEKLLRVLDQIHAVARHDDRKLKPNASHLIGPGHILLDTDNGHFDCLGEIDGGKSYDDLFSHSTLALLDDGSQVRVLELATLIEVKRRAGRAKDMAVMPVLEATLRESRRLGLK
ncbi:MAG TPA: hypothetical protein VEX18_07210 [Polyangiaceae bacterium]|nr:hypothetical protein [Polyangiaceae bacterium]